LVIKALDLDWIRIQIGIQPKMLELDPDPDEMNADPQPCIIPFLQDENKPPDMIMEKTGTRVQDFTFLRFFKTETSTRVLMV
jgi:hypothetical protein